MGLKEMLDETKEQAIEQGKKAIMKVLRPILLKGLAIILIVIVVAGSTIAVFDALGDVISGIITGVINAIDSVASKFSRWMTNLGFQDNDNYWIRLDTPYSETEDDIEIKYEEGENTSVAIRLASTNAGAIGAPTNSAVFISNGDIKGEPSRPFDKDDPLGITFKNIYGLDEKYQKTNLDATYIVGYGKEGIALFDYGGTLKAVNKEVTDIEFEYIALTETGFVLTNSTKTKLVTYDFELHVTSKDVNGRTLPDLYLEQLYSTGLSLDNLRVLVGGVDEKLSVDEILEDEEQREKAEKYIKEFLRADLISSSTHKTDYKKNVDETNSDKIDGGVYIWRTKTNMYEWNENDITNENALSNSENPEIQKMIFVPYNVFHTTYDVDMGGGAYDLSFINSKGWLKDYTINDNGEIEIFVFDLSYEGDESIPLSNIFGRDLKANARIATIDYKEYIKEYTMPFEFLMATAYTCENPEYAYHLAYMARETMIDLVVCDEYRVEYEKIDRKGHILHTERVNNIHTITTENGNKVDKVTSTSPLEDEIGNEITLEARTKFNLTGNARSFVVRADAWEKYLKKTLYRKGINPEIFEDGESDLNEVVDGPTPYHDTPKDQYPSPSDPSGNTPQYEQVTGLESTIMTSYSSETKSYDVKYDIKDIPANGDGEGYKFKTFYGLLRAKEKDKAIDKCESEEDIIKHLKDIETDEKGYNTSYKLQTIGIGDEPINILANERDVLYRQIETFGNAFNKKDVVTGENEHTVEENEENTTNTQNTTGTNYDWLYKYLDTAFSDFHLGKFQELEDLPDGFGELFGDWTGSELIPGTPDGHLPDSWEGEVTSEDGTEYTNRFGQKAYGYLQKHWGVEMGLGYDFWHGGCGQCCVATVISMFKGSSVGNPGHVWYDLANQSWAGLRWMLEVEGIPTTQIDYPSNPGEIIRSYLKVGKPVIMHLSYNWRGNFYSSHYVLAMGISEDLQEMIIIESGGFWTSGEYYNINDFLGDKNVLDLIPIEKAPPPVGD